MSTSEIQNVLTRCERVREAYATVATRINTDPKNNFQARRDDLAAALT